MIAAFRWCFCFAVKTLFTWFSLVKVFTDSVFFCYLMVSSPVSQGRLNYWWRWLSLSLSLSLSEAELQNERTNKEKQRGRKNRIEGKDRWKTDKVEETEWKRNKGEERLKGGKVLIKGIQRQKNKNRKDKWNKSQQRRKEDKDNHNKQTRKKGRKGMRKKREEEQAPGQQVKHF